MNALRIVFMGTPEFAVPALEILIENHINVVAVVTAPDKPQGRGQKIIYSPIKECALKHNLPVLQPTNLKAPEFIEELKSYNANLQIVVAFRMLPEMVWAMPAIGTFNLHASLLPDYRGAAPINWAIINGEKETGVTTFFLKQEIDTGSIIFQEIVILIITLNKIMLMENSDIEKGKVLITVEIIEYMPNSVVSKTIIKKSTGNISVMSFDTGEGLTEKISPFDTYAQIIEGEAEIVIDKKSFLLNTGESIIIPAHKSNLIKGNERFKMILTIIKSGYEA